MLVTPLRSAFVIFSWNYGWIDMNEVKFGVYMM